MPSPAGASLMTPAAVAAYLAVQGWVRSASTEAHETWSGPIGASADDGQIFLPTDRTLRDFDRRFQEALWGVEESFGLSTPDLVDAVTAVRADVFYLRLDQPTPNGTIPMRQATNLVDGAFRMMRAAATTTANPASTHTGRRPSQVIDFLEEDLRMGHTKRGSFVLTVVARHGELPSVPELDLGPSEPFSRRVVTTLSRALSETRRFAASGEDTTYLDPEAVASAGVSPELLQCLLDVSEPEQVKAVDFTFQWATGTEPPRGVAQTVSIPRDLVPNIRDLSERLQRRVEPEAVTLFGRIKSLTRDDSDADSEESSVVLEADVEGRLCNVTVPLSRGEYDWAIRAHQARLPFTVTGELVRRRTWRLQGEVRADLSFLRHQLDGS